MTIPGYIFPAIGLTGILVSFVWVAHLLSKVIQENSEEKVRTTAAILDQRIRASLSYLYFLKTRSGSSAAKSGPTKAGYSREELMSEIRFLNDQIEAAYTQMSDEKCIMENDQLLEMLTNEYDVASKELREIEENFEVIFLSG